MDFYQNYRNLLQQWQHDVDVNILSSQSELYHSLSLQFADEPEFFQHLQQFANTVATQIEPLVAENHQPENLPQLQNYDEFGNFVNQVKHHESYIKAGDLIYASNIMQHLVTPGHLTKTLALLLLSSHAGEAGHNCPIACSAGVMRILNLFPDVPNKDLYLHNFTEPSFQENFTGAQFLTEIQGGSDVGLNVCEAHKKTKGDWEISGEKWFCSNANADLILITARFDENTHGTKGLGLFLVPRLLDNNQKNSYVIKRLKDKMGTKTMATGEIDFHNATAFAIGEIKPGNGIHLVLENVLHLSRLFNAFSVLGMSRRAYQIAFYYAKHRQAFGTAIIDYPLVQQQLAKVKGILVAQIAASFKIANLQDQLDLANHPDKNNQLLLRLLTNLNKYFTAKYTVENVRHCLDILAGNGTIQTFSSIPRLLNDAIICENWEGTHFTLWMQILRDIHRYQVDEIFTEFCNQALKSIPSDHSLLPRIKTLLTDIEKLCQRLKTSDEAQQSLMVEPIVSNMAVVFSSLSLIQESLQQKSNAKEIATKLFLDYFTCHKQIDEQYLTEIKTFLNP